MEKPRKSTITRKSPEELVDAIMENLPVRTFTNPTEIGRKTNSNFNTVENWLKLIMHIQSLPLVISSPNPSKRGTMYQRTQKRYVGRG